jgi:LPXTG-site transpeptidase (sortase) family protein
MRKRLTSIDRRLAITGLVLLTSSLLLVVGLVSIAVTLNHDNVDLPDEGSLEQILREKEAVPAGDLPEISPPDAPDPIRIGIPPIGVDAPILAMGLDSNHYPQVPNSGADVAWYTFSAPPGRGSNAVMSGHVDWLLGDDPVKGVFYHLRELQIGDQMVLDLEDGSQLRYAVTANVAVPYNNPDLGDVMAPTAKDVITLITCGGTWQSDYSNANGGNYSHRIVVRAERVIDLASGNAGSEG